MSAAHDGVLLIDHGDLPSLASLALEPNPSRLILWPVAPADALSEFGPSLHRVVRMKAEAFSVRAVLKPRVERAGSEPLDAAGAAIAQGLLLLEALAHAAEHGCSRIIWPVQVGPDADAMLNLVQRVQLASSLAEIGVDRQSPPIDMPVADLSDSEVADLADDSGAPMHLFRPCQSAAESDALGSSPEPCGQCRGCHRWTAAFNHARLPWPWAAVTVG